MRSFLKFCTMKGAKWYMEIILMVLKKFSFGANGPLWARKWHVLISPWIHVKDAKRYMKIILIVLPREISLCANVPFLARKWCDFITLDPF